MRRALVVDGGGGHPEALLGALAAAGFEAVRVPSLAAARSLVEVGAVAVVVSAGVLEGQVSLFLWPPSVRRACVVVALGEDDPGGWKAFRLGVDLMLPTTEGARLGEVVVAALATKRLLVAPLDPAAASRLTG